LHSLTPLRSKDRAAFPFSASAFQAFAGTRLGPKADQADLFTVLDARGYVGNIRRAYVHERPCADACEDPLAVQESVKYRPRPMNGLPITRFRPAESVTGPNFLGFCYTEVGKNARDGSPIVRANHAIRDDLLRLPVTPRDVLRRGLPL
jgi:hypothetical protein